MEREKKYVPVIVRFEQDGKMRPYARKKLTYDFLFFNTIAVEYIII